MPKRPPAPIRVTERRVRHLIEKWRDLLGISPKWEFAVKLHQAEDESPEDERDCAAHVTNDGAYMRSLIAFNLWHRECQEDLESVVTHEMIHVLMDRIDLTIEDALRRTPGLYREMTESVTTALEGAFKAVRTGGRRG
jgi:hypothetical protein